MKKYRKKPVIIEAVRWNGSNEAEILDWVGSYSTAPGVKAAYVDDGVLKIKTLESGDGYHIADVGDFILKGVNNEFYPCKPDIFEKSYEPVE